MIIIIKKTLTKKSLLKIIIMVYQNLKNGTKQLKKKRTILKVEQIWKMTLTQ